MLLALPAFPTLLLEPPLTVVVVRLAEGVAAELRLPPEVVVLLLREELPVERLAVELERLVEEADDTLERLLPVLALEREVLLLERLVVALERLVLLPERDALLLERLVLPEEELLIVPPTALEVEPLLRLTLEDDELLRDELVWLEDEERLLPPLRDWALTGDIASAIAATAASASLNVVFIMLNFSIRKYSFFYLNIAYFIPRFISVRTQDLSLKA